MSRAGGIKFLKYDFFLNRKKLNILVFYIKLFFENFSN